MPVLRPDPEPEYIETANDHLIGSTGFTHIVVLLPPVGPMPYEEALRMAAWIVAIADPDDERFPKILKAVRGA